MKVTMLMLTFNRLLFTQIVLENYFKTTKYPHKLLVWDNCSTDGSRKWLDQTARQKYGIKVHLCKQNIGVPDAIRGFLRHPNCHGADLIGKIDNDVLVCSNWLENFVKAFEKVPELGIVAAYNKINPPKKFKNFNDILLAPSLHGMQGSLWLARSSVLKKYPFVERGYAGNWNYFGRLGTRNKVLLAYHRKVHYLTDRRQWGGESPFPDVDYRKYYAQIAKYRSYRHKGFLPAPSEGREIMKTKMTKSLTWSEVAKRKPLFLNLGGGHHCHPDKGYENYVSVDLRLSPKAKWSIQHDLKKPIPLPNNSVDRILTEDFLEHFTIGEIREVLEEAYRLLKPGGRMRIGVPDYNNPKDQPFLKIGKDRRFPGHKTLIHYSLMKKLAAESPFPEYKFYHYWDNGKFVKKPIDYSLGLIRRTPDNDRRCNPRQPLYVTSLVMDFFKIGKDNL